VMPPNTITLALAPIIFRNSRRVTFTVVTSTLSIKEISSLRAMI
jgi:hypothetical protein